MRQIIFAFTFLVSISIISCSGGDSESTPTGNNPQMYDVTVTVTPSDGGIISPSADTSYEAGSNINLQASPSEGWKFVEWQGDVTGTENPIELTVDGPKEVTAVFGERDFKGGDGTAANPYQVETIEQLQKVGLFLRAHFVQVADIDASTTTTWNNGSGFKPIGEGDDRFYGTYDGRGFTISNLYIHRTEEFYVGLFGYSSGAEITNVKLSNVDITGQHHVGGLAGNVDFSRISNSSSAGEVKGVSPVGGLVGNIHETEIVESYSDASVSGKEFIGGLVGNGIYVDIVESYATGTIHGEDGPVGGLAGEITAGPVSNSYALGNVEGSYSVGGFIGTSAGIVNNCFSSGLVVGEQEAGGFAGYNVADVSASYWDRDASAQQDAVGNTIDDNIIGLETEQMTGAAAQNNMQGFDFGTIWATTSGYPMLRWQQ